MAPTRLEEKGAHTPRGIKQVPGNLETPESLSGTPAMKPGAHTPRGKGAHTPRGIKQALGNLETPESLSGSQGPLL